MKPVHCLSGLVGLLGLLGLCGCGGGSSSSSATARDNFGGGGSNVVTMTVQQGAGSQGYFNQPLVSVKVCNSSSSNCVTVNDVLVDTGSEGLRLMASAVASIGLTATADPNNPSNTIQECLPFADGYAWGEVSDASVSIGGESTSGTVPIQVIDDSNPPSPAVPSSCSSRGSSLDSVDGLGANGILGVGVFPQDCGNDCTAQANVYYSCSSSGTCAATDQALAVQVTDPVVDFPTDNNGVILQLPGISSTGTTAVSGYLVFGIGTESNNALGNAAILTANGQGNFATTFASSTLSNSFIDSGSNAFFFNDSALQGSECYNNQFYCPASTTPLSATNQGENGTTSNVSFSIVNVSTLNGNNYAFDDVAGPAPAIPGFGSYFDWGVPFFYGRTVFFALDGAEAGGTAGPFYAY